MFLSFVFLKGKNIYIVGMHLVVRERKAFLCVCVSVNNVDT